MVSVILTNLFWIALVVSVVSFLARRFVWKSPWVYAVVAAGCAEVVFDFLTGAFMIGWFIWIAVAVGAYAWLMHKERTSYTHRNNW